MMEFIGTLFGVSFSLCCPMVSVFLCSRNYLCGFLRITVSQSSLSELRKIDMNGDLIPNACKSNYCNRSNWARTTKN